MRVRLKSTVAVRVPYALLDGFRAAVQRFALREHECRGFEFSYASAISDGSRPISNVRVLIDALADSDDTQEAGEAANETAIRALIHIKASDLTSTVTVELVH